LLREAAARVHAFEGDGSALRNIQGEPRNEQYARAGGIIVEQAQILFAVWDGLPARGTGGTAEQIGWFRQGSAPKGYSRIESDISPADPAEPGLLIRIDSSTGAVIPMPGAESITLGLSEEDENRAGESLKGATKSDIFDILKRTERFNRNVLSEQSRIAGNLTKSPLTKAMPSFLLDAAATYNAADTMAISFGRRIRDADIALYSAAVLAVFFFNMLNNWPIASWGYFVIVVLIVGTSIFLRKLTLEIRFLEYRGLAEALRVLFFWRVMDIRRQVWLGYLSKHSGVLQWVRHAVRSIEFCESYRFAKAPGLGAAGLVEKFWLDDQVEYYTLAGQKHLQYFKRWDTVSKISLGLSPIFSIAFLVLSCFQWRDFFHWKDEELAFGVFTASTSDIIDVLQVCLGLSLACGLAAKAYVIRRADFELSKQYLSARQTFILAKLSIQKSLRQIADGEEPAWTPPNIIERLGREALFEHAEWLWLRHARPFEMPN
jgi:hypothetical protein